MNASQDKLLRFWLVVTAVLLGAFLRFHELASLPISSGFDVAYYGLDALQILGGDLPVYFASNFGREALYSYIVAALFAGLGLSDFAIHLAASFAGVLTIPANYIVAQELARFAPWPLARRYAPILASFVLALMYWHLVWSRYGVRAILAPLAIALTMFFLLRALRTGKRRMFFLTGLGTGLGLHTYQIGQLLPFLVLGTIVLDYWSRRRVISPSVYLRPLLPLLLGFLALALPLALYAAAEPEAFNQRVRDVAVVEAAEPLAGQAAALGERVLILARFLTIEGDSHNMWSVGRLPGLNPFLLGGFVLGLALILWFWRRQLPRVIWLWLLIMLAPALLADSGTVSKRALGVLPVLTTLIGLGYFGSFAWLQARLPNTPMRVLGTAVVTAGLLFTFAHTYNAYFIVWATDDLQKSHFEPQLSEVGSYISTLPPDEEIYVSADAPNHPNMLLHSRLRTAGSTVHGYNGWRCFVYPELTSAPTTYVLTDEPSVANVQVAFPQGTLQTEGLSNRYGYGDYYAAYHVPRGATAQLGPRTVVEGAIWGDRLIALIGYDLPAQTAVAGERFTLTLYWQALRPMDTRYTAFVHLLGEEVNPANGNNLWAQQDNEPCKGYYPTAVWQEGEIIRDDIILDIPADAPPGAYDLSIGFYTWPEFQRLPVGTADTFTLQSIDVR